MATKKAAGSAKNLTDSKPKFLGVKLYDGQPTQTGSIIVRQRGSKIMGGKNVGVGKDYTLYALKEGKVKFRETRKVNFTGKVRKSKIVDVI